MASSEVLPFVGLLVQLGPRIDNKTTHRQLLKALRKQIVLSKVDLLTDWCISFQVSNVHRVNSSHRES